MNIVQKPDSLVFSGNIPDVVIAEVKNELNVLLWDIEASEIIFNEIYFPDSKKKVTIELRSVIEHLPQTDLFFHEALITPAEYLKRGYRLTFPDSIGLDPVEFFVLRGGLADFTSEDMPTFLNRHFLNWHLCPRICFADSIIQLAYVVTEECDFHVNATFAGSPVREYTEAIPSNVFGIPYSFNVSPHMISKIFGEIPLQYTVSVRSGCYSLTPEVIFNVSVRTDNFHEYLYRNSLGGIDTIVFSGKFSKTVKTESVLSVCKRLNKEGKISLTETFSQNTGYLSGIQGNLVRDFILSDERYHYVHGNLYRIVIEESENQWVDNALNAFEFEFRHEEEIPYLAPGEIPVLQPPFPEKIAACFDLKRGNLLIDRVRGYQAIINGNNIIFPVLTPDVFNRNQRAYWAADFSTDLPRKWLMDELNGCITIDYATDICSRLLFFRDIVRYNIMSAMPLIVYKEVLSDKEIAVVLKFLKEYYFLHDGMPLLIDGVPVSDGNTFVTDNSNLK